MEKEIKYYNNRPVTVIEKTTENMYLICANTAGNATELTGENFCSPCNIGGKETHTCEEAESVIEDILECATQENEVFWVDKRMLKDSYFEKKQNDELLTSINNFKKEKVRLEGDVKKLEQEETDINLSIGKFNKEAEEIKAKIEYLNKIHEEAEVEVKTLKGKLSDVKVACDLGVSISIGVESFKQLLEDQAELNALNIGGVDNWNWYEESCGNRDFREEAQDEVERLFKLELTKDSQLDDTWENFGSYGKSKSKL